MFCVDQLILNISDADQRSACGILYVADGLVMQSIGIPDIAQDSTFLFTN